MLRRGAEPQESVKRVTFTKLTEIKYWEEVDSTEGEGFHSSGPRTPEGVLTHIWQGLDENQFKGEIRLPEENRKIVITKLTAVKFWIEVTDPVKGDFQIIYRTPWAVVTYMTWELRKDQ